jgi:hypothetical protein
MCAQVVQALKDGLYDDWDAVEGIWDHIFRRALFSYPGSRPRACYPLQCQHSIWIPPTCMRCIRLVH